MFKSFYDPEVEKRGIVKGFEKGQNNAKEEIARNMISKGFNKEVIIELTGLSDEHIEKLIKERINWFLKNTKVYKGSFSFKSKTIRSKIHI